MANAEDAAVTGEDPGLPADTWTVAELNREIDAVLTEYDERFPTYVVGEIADVDRYHFGTFFDLADLDEEAVISCLAWSRVVESADHELAAGTKTVVRAEVDFYAERGECKLVATDYWPIGEGERTRQVAKLRATLDEEGLLDDERKRPLPPYPTCIGVVTSLAGSAREDLTATVHERHAGVRIKLCGATVQGEDAVPSVVGALRTLERDTAVDVIVVTRGGGADTDLWCFDEEPVVRAIADATTPVVAAIGHEDDEVLAEAVADARAMTPTAAAVETTPELADVRATVADLERRISDAYRGLVEDRLVAYRRAVDTALTALEHAAATRRAERRRAHQRAADLEVRIDRAYATLVAGDLDALESRIEGAVRDVDVERRLEAKRTEARRLRVAVAVLAAIVLVGSIAVATGVV